MKLVDKQQRNLIFDGLVVLARVFLKLRYSCQSLHGCVFTYCLFTTEEKKTGKNI